jgi:erythromycin esterase
MRRRAQVAATSARRVVLAIAVAACACGDDPPDREEFPTGPQANAQIPGVPPGWSGGSSALGEYEFGRDVQAVHGGTTSAYLRSRGVAPTGGGAISQRMRGERYWSRRVRLSGYVRLEGVTSAFGMYVRTDAPTDQRIATDVPVGGRNGTMDWTYTEIVADLPDYFIGVSIGVVLNGAGTGWVDDLKFEIVDEDVPATAVPASFPAPFDSATIELAYSQASVLPVNLDFEGILLPESQTSAIDWIRNNSHSFSTDDPEASDEDLQPLRQMIGSATLVGLGEGTHGTREFFRMKHRMVRYLVETLGFDHFSMEASMPEALAVDHYLQTGIGNPADLVRGMRFWTWSTEEVFDLVRWMRAWNAAGNQPQLRFSGFDMQYPDLAMDSVVAFTREISPALGESVRGAYQCLYAIKDPSTQLVSQPVYQNLDAGTRDECRVGVRSVDSLFAQRTTSWSPAYGNERTRLMKQLARLVSQWEDYARTAATATRDRYMAENVAWWRSRAGQSTGMMLWAHNLHVSRKAGWMGRDLGLRYGGDYVNVALTFSAGTFNASGTFGPVLIFGLAGAWPASFEALLDATGRDRVLFDARTMSAPGTEGDALRHRLTMRSIGRSFVATTSPAGYQAPLALPDEYDLVIWFRNTSATRLSLGLVAPTNWSGPN